METTMDGNFKDTKNFLNDSNCNYLFAGDLLFDAPKSRNLLKLPTFERHTLKDAFGREQSLGGGSITVWLVSIFTSFDLNTSRHTKNNIFSLLVRSSLISLNHDDKWYMLKNNFGCKLKL